MVAKRKIFLISQIESIDEESIDENRQLSGVESDVLPLCCERGRARKEIS